jgi:hypothetical protein
MDSVTKPPKTTFRKYYARCLHDFDATSPSELTVRKGEFLRILRNMDSGWCCAQSRRGRGWLPTCFTHKISDDVDQMLNFVSEELKLLTTPADEQKKKEERKEKLIAVNKEKQKTSTIPHPYALNPDDGSSNFLDIEDSEEPYMDASSSSVSSQSLNSEKGLTSPEDDVHKLPKVATVKRFIVHITSLPLSECTFYSKSLCDRLYY